MRSDHRRLRIRITRWRDGALFCLAFYAAHYIRADWLPQVMDFEHVIQPFHNFLWLWLIIFPGAPLILESQGFYKRPLLGRRRDTAWILLKSCLAASVGVVLVMFLLRAPPTRSVIVCFGLISFALIFLNEEMMRVLLRSRLGLVQWRQRIILVGNGDDNARLRRELGGRFADGVEPVAELDLDTQGPEALIGLLHQHSANGVLIQGGHSSLAQLENLLHVCELEGVEALLVADFFKTRISRRSFDEFQGRPVLVFRSAPEASWQGVLKMVFDFVSALLLLLVTAPVLALVGLLIKLGSPGPVLFRQRRCGLNGRPFVMWKFRSMATDAEQRKHELAQFNEMSGPVFKVTNDPRVTPIGRILRKFSIDEFPQLWNVLRGDMSLVGPRPLPVEEVERFQDIAHRRRLSVKPGLTCLWQIGGRNEVRSFDEWVRLDLEYIDNWSFWLDLRILARTIPVVLLGKGAK